MERHDTLLISSGSAENRAYLRAALDGGFNLLEAVNINQTMMLLQQNSHCIAALLLDITTMSDEEKMLIRKKENMQLLHMTQIIVFTEDDDTIRLNRAFNLGAADVIPIDYEPYAMLHRIENIVQLHLRQHLLSLKLMFYGQQQIFHEDTEAQCTQPSILSIQSLQYCQK